MMIVGGGAAGPCSQRVTPRYTSLSRIYVERNMPRLLDEQMQAMQSASYLYTQAELIRSGEVLADVAEDRRTTRIWRRFATSPIPSPSCASTLKSTSAPTTKSSTSGSSCPTPRTRPKSSTRSSTRTPCSTAKIANKSATELLVMLRNEKQIRDEELKKRREELDEFRKQHPELAVQVSHDNVVTLRFAALSETLNSTEIELLQAKALYNRVKKMYDTPTQRPYLLEMAGAEHQAMRDSELERQVKQLEQALVSERARWGEGHHQQQHQSQRAESDQRLAHVDRQVADNQENFVHARLVARFAGFRERRGNIYGK